MCSNTLSTQRGCLTFLTEELDIINEFKEVHMPPALGFFNKTKDEFLISPFVDFMYREKVIKMRLLHDSILEVLYEHLFNSIDS